ncbi:MAG: hypothetical protein AABY01_03695 [Nanoarchaeota archaeon]
MAEQIIYFLNDPGTNNIYSVVLDETSRTEVTSQIRAKEIIFDGIINFAPDESFHNSMSPADITTIATAAAQDLQTSGYLK